MILWKRALLLGFLSWLIPLLASMIVFPLKQWNAPLFQSLMSLIGLATGGLLLCRYFRKRPVTVREAGAVGVLWLAMNLALDYPLFFKGAMQMTASAYYSEIGAAYVAIPLFAVLAARLARS